MGNSTSRVVGCFAPFGNGKDGVDVEFLEPLDEGLGHSFCYVRPMIMDSPAITPSNSDRFMVDSNSTFDTDTLGGSFRKDIVEDASGLQRPIKNLSETTFGTISGASVSANASTVRTGNPSMVALCDAQEPAATFESTSSFAAIPLQPVPRGSGPLNGFMSGPLERGFASGPLDRGGGFMSGPLEKGLFMSGPLDTTDRNNFSAPLAYAKRKTGLSHLVRSVSKPMRSAFSRSLSRNLSGPNWMQRFFVQPMTQYTGHPKNGKFRTDAPRNFDDIGPSENDYNDSRNLQWAHGKAGEDRVHVVLSEEQGWLFVGIYDGFSGPDAPDYLMSNLYRAIDKELEGLLWDYECKLEKQLSAPTSLEISEAGGSDLQQINSIVEIDLKDKFAHSQFSDYQVGVSDASGNEFYDESIEKKETKQLEQKTKQMTATQRDRVTDQHCSVGCCEDNVGTRPHSEPSCNENSSDPTSFSKQGRKSMRLYELLQMELIEDYAVGGSLSVSEIGSRNASFSFQSEDSFSRGCLPSSQVASCSGDGSNKQKNDAMACEESNGLKQLNASSFSTSGHRQVIKHSLIGARLRKMYRKQKSLRKKLFPWSYDWHREQTHVNEGIDSSSVSIRRCKSGPVDHDAVLQAMARALENTEVAYMDMVEKALDRNPELALMGSCVLVMLMKDQDVYVMNLGDSRAVLAQEKPSDHHIHSNTNLAKDDARLRNRSRESLVRVELDRISEESPMHNLNTKVHSFNKNRELSIYRLKMKALQLSTDHSTSIEEEVVRIKEEHSDDPRSVFNDRVKGQLKVTRAFGAAFLKKPNFNEALLEMFRIDYVGNFPYVSCIPYVLHHHLSADDRFLVLSSDGLYQYFSNDEVVSHVAWFIENVPGGDPAQYLIAELLFRAARKNGMDFHELLDIPQGDRRKYHDDVSVMVISLEGRIWRSSG